MNESKKLYQLSNALALVPAVAADVIAKKAWVYQVVVANVTASAATLQVLDKATAPKQLIPTQSIAANTTVTFSFPEGVEMTGGIRWVAGTVDALHASIKGVYSPGA